PCPPPLLPSFPTRRSSDLFVHYLERDFPRVLGGTRGVREHNGIRVVSAGPNAFVYFLEHAAPLPIEWIEGRFPGLGEDLSRSRGDRKSTRLNSSHVSISYA